MISTREEQLARLSDQSIIQSVRRVLLKAKPLNKKHDQSQAFQSLTCAVQHVQKISKNSVLNRSDEIGVIARSLISEIEVALKHSRTKPTPFHMEYQPKVNIQGEVVGAEALLRWNHSVYGYISPLVIVSLCDEAGLTTRLGTWVIRNSFAELKNWREKGYENITLSVNLDPRQVQEDDDLVATLRECIAETGIDPSHMELELTENAALEINDATRSTFQQIKAAGMNVSIDDFGMGHSSLLYLCDLKANIIKIDMALIRDIVRDKQKESIVSAIISLCKKLSVSVIAEGVETKAQADLLNQLGCQYFQGFHYSASLSSEKFLRYVDQNGAHSKRAQPVQRFFPGFAVAK